MDKPAVPVMRSFSGRSSVWAAVLLTCMILVAGCASVPPPPTDTRDFRERVERRQAAGVAVAVSVLGAAESEAEFGAPLASRGIQPVWLEIENREAQKFVLMLLSIDPDYFSPSEVAWQARGSGTYEDFLRRFDRAHIPIVIPPHARRAGFVYTNLDPGAKAVTVQLIGERDNRNLEFVLPVPGFEADFDRINLRALYRPDEVRDVDLAGLRAYLESLPCCVSGGDKATPGDPLNLVAVGDGLQMLTTFVRQGWDLTETIRSDTVWATIGSSLFGSRYRTSPISPLYVFGRPQDVALQKARQTVDERNHLRLWLAPVRFEEKDVWVGQVSRDIGVKLSSKTFVTHKIDPMVDEARLYVLLDLARSQYLARAGFVKGVGFASIDAPRFNYTGDPYYTDGLRTVLFLSDKPHTYQEIEWLDWALLPGGLDIGQQPPAGPRGSGPASARLLPVELRAAFDTDRSDGPGRADRHCDRLGIYADVVYHALMR